MGAQPPASGVWLLAANVEGPLWPDFVARLTDGRLFVVEYKGAPYVANAAEDRLVGQLWASELNRFVMVEGGRADGADPATQMREALST